MTGDRQSGPVPTALLQAIRGHPDFPAAMRQSVVELVGAHARNRLFNRLISDRGRALFGIYALYLHHHADATGAGLTPARMAELCAELAIIAPLNPAAGAVAARLDRPEVFARLAVELGGVLRAGFRLLDQAPALLPVAERDNGLLLCFLLARSGDPDAPVPPDAPITVSIADLAARARVSRSHARNLLALAERQGLIARDIERGRPERVRIACRPLLAEALKAFFVATFAAMIVAATRVLDAEGPTPTGPARG